MSHILLSSSGKMLCLLKKSICIFQWEPIIWLILTFWLDWIGRPLNVIIHVKQRRGTAHIVNVVLFRLSVGRVMLGALLLLSLFSLVAPGPPPSGSCRRCCDHLDPPEGTRDQRSGRVNHMPEVRTYINMTILKGNFKFSFCRICSFKMAGLVLHQKGLGG